jgi:hypothetical protein
MSTLILDAGSWDLVLDINGNIAIAEAPYAIAQDVCSAIRLVLGELWYDTTQGVPYATILGTYPPNVPLIKSLFTQAALTVPGVASAVVTISAVQNRLVTGQVQITMTSGQTVTAPIVTTFAPLPPPPIPPVTGNSLDFSNPDNSQFLPGGL